MVRILSSKGKSSAVRRVVDLWSLFLRDLRGSMWRPTDPGLISRLREPHPFRFSFCLARLDEVFVDHSVAAAAHNEARDAQDEARMAIWEHRCSSLEEAAIRAKYLVESGVDLQTVHDDALFASFLPEEELAIE